MKRNISDDIYTYLLTEIREHRLLPGGILPSESTLCRQFYVSRPTVRKVLARLGVRLPEDLDVICFDDVENFTETIGVPVSCIRMPLRTMGAQAVEYLIRKIRNPECEKVEQMFRASLVVNRCKFLLPPGSAAFCRTPVSPDAEPPSLPRRIPG